MLRHIFRLGASVYFVWLLVACMPLAQESEVTAVMATQPESQLSILSERLVGSSLAVPDADTAFIVDEDFVRGELVAFTGPEQDKGTVRLLREGLSIEQENRSFYILPLEVLRVSGAGGLYLLLLEQLEPESVKQQGSYFVEKGVRLLELEFVAGVLSVTTIDARLAKPPASQPSKGGTIRYRLENASLLKL